MNANESTKTKSIGSSINDLFDVDAMIKTAESHAGEANEDIARVLHIASGKIRAVASDLDVIDFENSQRSRTLPVTGVDVVATVTSCEANEIVTTLTTICALAARAMGTSGSDHDILWAIEELSRSMKEKIEQSDSVSVA